MDIFYEDPSVFYLSVHQDPRYLYPGIGFAWEIGRGRGKGYTCNVPLPPGAGLRCYRVVFERVVEPLVREFNPDVIIANGGCDPHFLDPLTDLGLNMQGFYEIGSFIRKLAGENACKAVDLILSGYNPDVIPRAWSMLVGGLAGVNPGFKDEREPVEEPYVVRQTERVVEEVRGYLSGYWHI